MGKKEIVAGTMAQDVVAALIRLLYISPESCFGVTSGLLTGGVDERHIDHVAWLIVCLAVDMLYIVRAASKHALICLSSSVGTCDCTTAHSPAVHVQGPSRKPLGYFDIRKTVCGVL